jgi:hypothetical protein
MISLVPGTRCALLVRFLDQLVQLVLVPQLLDLQVSELHQDFLLGIFEFLLQSVPRAPFVQERLVGLELREFPLVAAKVAEEVRTHHRIDHMQSAEENSTQARESQRKSCAFRESSHL